MPDLNTSVRSNRQIFFRPAGKPRFGRTTSQPPLPSGISRLKGFACLLLSLADRDVDGRISRMHPAVCDQPKRTARRRIVAEIDFDVMIARDALILAAPKGIEIVSVKSADDVRNILAVVVDGLRDLAWRRDCCEASFAGGITKRSSTKISVPSG